MSNRCKLRKEYFKEFGKYKGNGKYSDNYVIWLEDQILSLRNEIPENILCSVMCCQEKAVSIDYNETFYVCEKHKN